MEVACMPATDHGNGGAEPAGLLPCALVSSRAAMCPPPKARTPHPALRTGCGVLLPERLLVTVCMKDTGRVLKGQICCESGIWRQFVMHAGMPDLGPR